MLDYLDFETSDDGEGTTTFDAMAYTAADRWPALKAEVERVLAWCTADLGPPGALAQGHRWDLDLQLQTDTGDALACHWDAPLHTLAAAHAADGNALQLSLTISMEAPDAAAFEGQFLADAQ